MARRYFACKVVDFQTLPGAPVVRLPKLLTPKADGSPRFPDGTSTAVVTHPNGEWAMVVVSNPIAVPTFPSDSDIEVFPDVPLSVEWGAADRGERVKAEAGLQRFGATVPGMASGEGFRFFVRRVGQQCDQAFNEDVFGVPG